MIPVFNFLRCGGCFLVVLTHIVGNFIGYERKYIFFILPEAAMGMAIFFFITGFLIPLSLDKLESPKKFLIRRCFRLFPVLFFSICFVIFFHYICGYNYNQEILKVSKLIKSVFITLFSIDFFPEKNFNFATNLIVPTSWSLAVEWKFYLIAALSWFIFKDSRSRLYGMFAFIGILLAITLNSNPSYFSLRHNVSLMYVCLVGSATYFYYSKSISKKEFLLLLLLLFVVMFQVIQRDLQYWRGIFYICGAFIATIFVLKLPNFGNNKICKFFADISYSMYLLHVMFILFVSFQHKHLVENFSLVEKIICGLCIYLALIPFCYLIYRFIEKPCIKIGYKLTDGVKK